MFGAAGGGVTATISSTSSTVTGTVELSGSIVTGGPVTGTISCRTIELSRSDGSVQVTGTISSNGRHVTGTYTATVPDHGTISLDAT